MKEAQLQHELEQLGVTDDHTVAGLIKLAVKAASGTTEGYDKFAHEFFYKSEHSKSRIDITFKGAPEQQDALRDEFLSEFKAFLAK